MTAWIDCPEQAPAPGWWWFRAGHAVTVGEVCGRPHGIYVGSSSWDSWRRAYPEMWPIPIALPGAAIAPEPLPRSTEQEMRAWAASVERAYNHAGNTWQRGYRHAMADVLEILDAAGDEPDPENAAKAGILLDEKDERLDALEKRVAAILASMEDGARQRRAADLAHLQASLAVTEEVMRHGTRLDDHVNRFEVLETRLDSYGKRLDRAEQARAEQQKATAAELEELRRLLEGLRR